MLTTVTARTAAIAILMTNIDEKTRKGQPSWFCFCVTKTAKIHEMCNMRGADSFLNIDYIGRGCGDRF